MLSVVVGFGDWESGVVGLLVHCSWHFTAFLCSLGTSHPPRVALTIIPVSPQQALELDTRHWPAHISFIPSTALLHLLNWSEKRKCQIRGLIDRPIGPENNCSYQFGHNWYLHFLSVLIGWLGNMSFGSLKIVKLVRAGGGKLQQTQTKRFSCFC